MHFSSFPLHSVVLYNSSAAFSLVNDVSQTHLTHTHREEERGHTCYHIHAVATRKWYEIVAIRLNMNWNAFTELCKCYAAFEAWKDMFVRRKFEYLYVSNGISVHCTCYRCNNMEWAIQQFDLFFVVVDAVLPLYRQHPSVCISYSEW